MEPKDLLTSRMEDLAEKAAKTGRAFSRFLTPAEAARAASYFSRRKDVSLVFEGGVSGAERTRAVFLNPDWGGFEREEAVSALKITVPPQEKADLSHRDVLGALMGLGVKRDSLGDILESGGDFVLLCVPELGGFIAENLTQIGRAHITITRVGLDELPARAESLTEKTDTVASLRLDAVLCAAFGLSRGRAAGFIEAARVSLNHEPCVAPAKEVAEGAIISVRGLGRAKLLEIGGTSKKGRLFVRIGLYE
jgi:RNA-binding protein YlmH